MKNRNIVLCLVFTFLTFGLYGIYWQVSLSNGLVEATKEKHFSMGGVLALILTMLTCGLFGIYWIYKMGVMAGDLKGGNDGFLYLILTVLGLGFIPMLLAQSEINNKA